MPFRRPGSPEHPPSPFCVVLRFSFVRGFSLVCSFRILRLSRGLGPPGPPLPVVSVFLGFSVVWEWVVVSGLCSNVSKSGVLSWRGGGFCGLAVCEAQGVIRRRGARRCVRNASPVYIVLVPFSREFLWGFEREL